MAGRHQFLKQINHCPKRAAEWRPPSFLLEMIDIKGSEWNMPSCMASFGTRCYSQMCRQMVPANMSRKTCKQIADERGTHIISALGTLFNVSLTWPAFELGCLRTCRHKGTVKRKLDIQNRIFHRMKVRRTSFQ